MSAAICPLILGFLSTLSAIAADEAPRWLQDAAAKPVPTYAKDVPAVVLASEETVTMDETGRIVTESRHVVKILTREGRNYARGSKYYENGAGRIRELRAWLVSASGQLHKLGKEATTEASVADDELYSDLHTKVMSAADKAEPGAVFGFESVVEEKTVFTQFDWAFQGRLPVVHARYTLNLPSGWEARSITFNHEPLKPAVSGYSYSWELNDLPYIEREPASPGLDSLVPRVCVSVLPSGGRTPGRAFNSWADVSAWMSELHDPQAAVTPAIADKAKALTSAATTEMEKIEAIGRFVQGTRYVEILMNLGRGGGMKPHSAAESLAKSYGDCKDKANLMRALLKAVGIASYPVVIYAGDSEYVRENWPSPMQFNHCIIAVAVHDAGEWKSAIRHPVLGPLLIFDPTDPHTLVGDLPDSDRDSLALVVAGNDGALLRMPSPPGSRTELTADLKLQPNGALSGTVHETSFGAEAAHERAMLQHYNHTEYMRIIERWFSSNVPAAKLSRVETADSSSDQFRLDIDFAAAGYGQLMQGRLLVFRPGAVTQRSGILLSQPKRKYPVVLHAQNYSETFRVEVPEGFMVDELPDSGRLDSPYGAFRMSIKAEGSAILLTRSLELKSITVPAQEYAKVKDFFGKIGGAESSPVVLVKK